MKKAQIADKDVDASTAATGYKQALDSLSASISACAGTDLLSEEADVVADARELEKTMKIKVTVRVAIAKETLLRAMSTAEITRECAPLAAYLERLVADEVLRESCGDAVESAKKVLSTLRAEEKERVVAVSARNIIYARFVVVNTASLVLWQRCWCVGFPFPVGPTPYILRTVR